MINNHHNCLAAPISFADCPQLVNPQYKARTLGELVALARATGQRPELMPNVQVRKGVYFCGSDPTNAIVPPRDKFDLADTLRNTSENLFNASNKLADAQKQLSDEKAAAINKELESLRAQLAAATQNPVE